MLLTLQRLVGGCPGVAGGARGPSAAGGVADGLFGLIALCSHLPLSSFFFLFLIFFCSFVFPCFEFPKEEVKCLKDKTEMAMATHSCILAWKIPWTGEPGGLQSMGSLRVRHD